MFGAAGAKTFNALELRTDQNHSWSYDNPQTFLGVRDQFGSQTLLETGQAAQHYKYVFLYINGLFWGMYDMIEPPDAGFAASYYGGDAAGYDALKATNLTHTAGGTYVMTAIDGTTTAWDSLFAAASTWDLSTEANYQKLQGNNPDGTPNAAYPNLLDVNNLVHYMLFNYYVGNYDGPYSTFVGGPNNFNAIRPIDGRFGFRFVAVDNEWSLLSVNQNSVNLANTGITSSGYATPAYYFQKLEANANFRLRVADAVQKDFFNGGPMSVAAATARFTALTNSIRGAVVGESARWGNAVRKGNSYTRDADWTPLVNTMLASYLPQRTAVVLGQLQALGLYVASPPPPTFNQYGGTIPVGFQLVLSAASGTVYYTLDGTDPRNADGSLSAAAVAYAGPVTLSATTTVFARTLSGTSWSAAVTGSFVTAASSVRITELHYNPTKPTGSTFNNDDFEFVELENFSAQTVNLAGVTFTLGINYTLPAATLGAWEVGVLVHNLAAFQSRYGTGVNVLGSYQASGDSFNNSGEVVDLRDAAGNVLDHFDYTASVVAYPTTKGKGPSLEILDPTTTADLTNAVNWRAGPVANGTPGTIPLLLGATDAYLSRTADGQRVDVWAAATNAGSPLMSVPIAEVYGVTFAGPTHGLTLDFTNGSPLAAATPVALNGGSLRLVGSTGADTLTVTATTATFANGAGSTPVAYANASAITFVGNGGGDTLTQSAQPAAPLAWADPTVADTLTVAAGTFAFPSATTAPTSLASLSVGSTATVTLGGGALAVDALTLTGGGRLDLGSHGLIVRNASLATVTAAVASAFAGGTWTGPGITSAAARDDGAHLTWLGVFQPDAAATFDTLPVAPTDVVVRYTLVGDTNLDGTVTAADYTRTDVGYVTAATGWAAGDFNYDGVVDGSDYTLIDNAYNQQPQAVPAIATPAARVATPPAHAPAPWWSAPAEDARRHKRDDGGDWDAHDGSTSAALP